MLRSSEKYFERVLPNGRTYFVTFIKNEHGEMFVLTGEKYRVLQIPDEVDNPEGITEEVFFEYLK